jgi:hypothetical protein
MAEESCRQNLKGHHLIRAEVLRLFAHKQGPLVIEQQRPRVPSPVACDGSGTCIDEVMLTYMICA